MEFTADIHLNLKRNKTPWRQVLLSELNSSLVQKTAAFCGTQNFIAIATLFAQ
jgi:hypothetical protein